MAFADSALPRAIRSAILASPRHQRHVHLIRNAKLEGLDVSAHDIGAITVRCIYIVHTPMQTANATR